MMFGETGFITICVTRCGAEVGVSGADPIFTGEATAVLEDRAISRINTIHTRASDLNVITYSLAENEFRY